MATYSIKDLEKMSGIKAHTIRIWEKRYSLVNPSRTNTNIRFYDDFDLKKLLNTSILIRSGLKISKISLLTNKEISDKVLLYSQQHVDNYSSVENLIISMIELDEIKFDRLLSNLVITMGFEEVFIKVLYPLFERIGILWQAGAIIPAQEHFISNLVRQKLIVAIESQSYQSATNQTQFALFLPEGELHELGLLFYNYTLRKRGYKTYYFGQNVPFEDIVQLSEGTQFQFMLTCINTSLPGKKLKEYICKLSATFPLKTIFICGSQTLQINFDTPSNIIKITNPANFAQRIDIIN
jgi:DNA-binding transcriptional MerR regulator